MNLDEIRLVLNCLRKDCQKTKSAKRAIKIISSKTGLDEVRVKKILIKLYANN